MFLEILILIYNIKWDVVLYSYLYLYSNVQIVNV